MRDHIKILAILNIIWSSLLILGGLVGLVVLLVFGGLAGLLTAMGANGGDNTGGLLVAPFMAVIGVFVLVVLFVVSLPCLIGGIGLLKMKSWARPLMIVLSVLHLLSIPVGTALGAYGLWVLFHEDTKRLFGQGTQFGYAQPMPPPPRY